MSEHGRAGQLAEALLGKDIHHDPERDWWRGAMFYEIYVRSFRDANNDGLGDLRGVIEKLDYIEGLGVDGIWLSPFYPSPQEDFGYDITDFCSVADIHGSLDDFTTLVRDAHGRGLKILTDFIPCHTSAQHPWFAESRTDVRNPRADWYVWADPALDGGPPNNWMSSFGGSAWTWEPRRAQYYYHPFLDCQPALNLYNDDVLQAVIEALRFWLDLGVDGFRLDAIQCLAFDRHLRSNPPRFAEDDEIPFGGGPNNPFIYQQHLFDRDVPAAVDIVGRLRDGVADYDPPRALIGELADVDSARVAVKYTSEGDRLHAVYDFSLINNAQTLKEWLQVLQTRSEFIGNGWLMNVFTNHDSARAVSRLTGFAEEAGLREAAGKLLLFLQATLRGGGIVYQGEELALPQPELAFEDLRDPWAINLWPDFEGRDGVRTPMPWVSGNKNGGFTDGHEPWIPIPAAHRPLSVDRQDAKRDSVLNFFRALMRWRRSEPLLVAGDEEVSDASAAPLLIFDRCNERRRLTFAANLSLQERWFELENGELMGLPGEAARHSGNGILLPRLGFCGIERDGAQRGNKARH